MNVTSENDADLTDYFYDMPAILWVALDGTLHGSWNMWVARSVRQ